jgi:hypothetical protein
MNTGTDWVDQARRLLDVVRGGLGDAVPAAADGESATGHSSDCHWCPLCRVASVVRGERPEVTAALADVLTATATALRTFAAAAGGETAHDAGSAPGRADERDETPAVQRIEIA